MPRQASRRPRSHASKQGELVDDLEIKEKVNHWKPNVSQLLSQCRILPTGTTLIGATRQQDHQHVLRRGDVVCVRPDDVDLASCQRDTRKCNLRIVLNVYSDHPKQSRKVKDGFVWVHCLNVTKPNLCPKEVLATAPKMTDRWGIGEVILTEEQSVEWALDITSTARIFFFDQQSAFDVGETVCANDFYVRYMIKDDKLLPVEGNLLQPTVVPEDRWYKGNGCCNEQYAPNDFDKEEIYCVTCERWFHLECLALSTPGNGTTLKEMPRATGRWVKGDKHLFKNLTDAPVVRGAYYNLEKSFREDWMLQGSGPATFDWQENAEANNLNSESTPDDIHSVFGDDQLINDLIEINVPFVICSKCKNTL